MTLQTLRPGASFLNEMDPEVVKSHQEIGGCMAVLAGTPGSEKLLETFLGVWDSKRFTRQMMQGYLWEAVDRRVDSENVHHEMGANLARLVKTPALEKLLETFLRLFDLKGFTWSVGEISTE